MYCRVTPDLLRDKRQYDRLHELVKDQVTKWGFYTHIEAESGDIIICDRHGEVGLSNLQKQVLRNRLNDASFRKIALEEGPLPGLRK